MVDLVSLFTSEVLRKQKITKAMIKAAALLPQDAEKMNSLSLN